MSEDMIAVAAASLVALVLAIIVPMYRRVREQDASVRLWGRSWESTAEAAEALASAMGLARERSREGSSWLSAILMAPIWLLWDPMGIELDSMRRLARWRLVGARASGRSVRVEFPGERVQFALRCESHAFFWAMAKRDDTPWPIEEQEGLRLLHPIGGPRWQHGSELIHDAFAQSLGSLRLRGETLFAEMTLDERGPLPAQYPRLLESLERVAIWLESIGSDGALVGEQDLLPVV